MISFCRNFVLIAGLLFANQGVAQETASSMVDAANAFIRSLTPDQRSEIMFEINDTSREIWHFLPLASFDRFGLALSELNEAQDALVYELINSALSDEGYSKATQIMSLESILKELENNSPTRDPQQYHISIYGKPAKQGIWSWGFSGHHLSLHFTIVDGVIASTPTFMGTNPAEVRSGAKKGLRVLEAEEDLAFDLLRSLSPDQLKDAIILENSPREIFTAAESKVEPLDQVGVSFGDMNSTQQSILRSLVEEYLSTMPDEIQERRQDKIEMKGWNSIFFAWAGTKDRSGGHYYRVQGPTFLIEFDNTQNNANHVHTVWRDFNGDFGRDLIKDHYKASH